jgi:hypothetical protein
MKNDTSISIEIQFPDGNRIKITKRSDYKAESVQKLLEAHKGNPLGVRCWCRLDRILRMLIATTPLESAESQVTEESASDFKPAVKRTYYLRRDHQTSGAHAEGCPNSLYRRDRTWEQRGDRKYPLSLFGEPKTRPRTCAYAIRNGGATTGTNLGDYANWCNAVVKPATHKAALLSGTPFGTPSAKTLFACIAAEILAFGDLVDPSLNPFAVAEKKGCRIEFGLCEYANFGNPPDVDGVPIMLDVLVADANGNLHPGVYSMDAKVLAAAGRQIKRHKNHLHPPYVWIGVISEGTRIVRYWQWPAVLSFGKLLLKDSEPEADFTADALMDGKAVYKVKSIEDANALLRLLVPGAGPLLSLCDHITWDGRVATIVEVVKRRADKSKYWRDLKKKEEQPGGYHDLVIKGRLCYERKDMGHQFSLGR